MTSTVPPGREPLCIDTRSQGGSKSARRESGKVAETGPGTSCLATISLSLRDKSHLPIEA